MSTLVADEAHSLLEVANIDASKWIVRLGFLKYFDEDFAVKWPGCRFEIISDYIGQDGPNTFGRRTVRVWKD